MSVDKKIVIEIHDAGPYRIVIELVQPITKFSLKNVSLLIGGSCVFSSTESAFFKLSRLLDTAVFEIEEHLQEALEPQSKPESKPVEEEENESDMSF